MNASSKSPAGTVLALAGAAAVIAVLRYFMRGWLEPLGVPTIIGSLLASVTVVLIIGLLLLFIREGRNSGGRYLRAAAWFVALAVWCELLVIGGILLTERNGANTYYQGPWEAVRETFPTGAGHAIGHAQGFIVRTAVWLIVGAVVYWAVKRNRNK